MFVLVLGSWALEEKGSDRERCDSVCAWHMIRAETWWKGLDVGLVGRNPCLGRSAQPGIQGFRHKVIQEPGGVRGVVSSLGHESAGVQRRDGEVGRRGSR